MATRLYLTSRIPGVTLTGPLHGDWSGGDSTRDVRALRHWTFLLNDTAVDGGAQTSIFSSPGVSMGASVTKVNDQHLIAANSQGGCVWVTKPLSGTGTLSGTLDFIFRVVIPAGTGPAGAYHVYGYISQGDQLLPRAVIIDNVTDATAWTDSATWRQATFALDAQDWQDGDRIVLEIGAVISPSTIPVGDNEAWMAWGTTNTSHVVQADAVNNDAGTLLRAAWAEFSQNLTFQSPPAAPPNDACVDAEVIAALPFQAAVFDSSQSADTARSVWYTWTAPSNMRVFGNSWGGNYSTQVRVWRGSCGGLLTVSPGTTNNALLGWIGTSQAAVWFDAVAGTQYWFQVSSTSFSFAPDVYLSARNSGGATRFALYAYAAPASGDLFVNCQHIVTYRAGQPVLATSAFYGQTPTNSVIDYSLRPMDNLNGGIHSGRRLNVDLFGASPIVEVLDLDTLNVGQSEIDFMFDPLNYAGNSENLASIVIDATGRLVLGYFGDNYNVIGILSTPNQCRINRIDATHCDSQAGAPFADAEMFTVDQDVGGSDYVDLSTDQTTLFYTSSGREVKRFDLDGNIQLADFALLPIQPSAPRPGARGVRLLSPYDGTGGMLVAYGDVVHRLDSGGTIIQSYTPAETTLAQDLDKVELDDLAVTFWVSDQLSTHLFQFNIETGAQVSTLETFLPPGQLCGFTILGYRATPPPPGGSGTIIVVKDVIPNGDPTLFDYVAGGGLSPTSFSLGDGDSFIYASVPVGSGYSVEETPNPLYTTGVVVSNGSPHTNLTVGVDEVVTVTFTNTRTTPAPPAPGGPGCPVEFPVEPSADHACAVVWTP